MSQGSFFKTAWLLVWLLLVGCAAPQPDPDLILHNGVFWTLDEEQPQAQAVAIREGRFWKVGGEEEILSLRGPQTEVIDLEGAFVVPGFVDNHTHFQSAARFLEFNIMQVRRQEEFERRLREVVERLEPGEWIVGGFWGAYDQWAAGSAGQESLEPFTPDLSRVQELTSRHPLFLRKFDNSEFAVNQAALREVGLHPLRPQAPGVEFVRDREGRFTGIVKASPAAWELFRDHLPRDFSRRRRLEQTRRALREIRRHGVTTISDMSDDLQLELFRELRERGELTVRVHFRYGLERWQELAEQGIRVGSGDEWIRLGALKGHIDGIMGTSTARFFEPYLHQPGNRGSWRPLMLDEEGKPAQDRFLNYLLEADRAGLQLSVHAIGDEANHVLLNFLEELERRNGKKDRRFRLVHAQVIAPQDFPRLGALGVIAEVQPFHLSDDMRWMEERIGRERCRGAYAFRSIQESGALLTFGSDWPGTSASEYPINPMLGIYAAVTRQTVAGEPPEGWFPEQRLSVHEALKAYIWNSAYANFEEDLKGSIRAGKLADLAVLSQNLLEIPARQILHTKVLYTLVGGRVVYRSAP